MHIRIFHWRPSVKSRTVNWNFASSCISTTDVGRCQTYQAPSGIASVVQRGNPLSLVAGIRRLKADDGYSQLRLLPSCRAGRPRLQPASMELSLIRKDIGRAQVQKAAIPPARLSASVWSLKIHLLA